MCGRYYIEIEDKELQDIFRAVEKNLQVRESENMQTGEIYPTNIVPAVASAGILPMQWGFPRYDGKGVVINARTETVNEKPMFAAPFRSFRCLLPASYYFEWRNEDGKKIKHRMYQPGSGVIFLAGVARDNANDELPKFVILTRPAAPGIAYVHDRMPLILPRHLHEIWLRGDANEAASAIVHAETDIDAIPA